MANSFRCGKSIVALANWETASRRQMAHLISLAIDLILRPKSYFREDRFKGGQINATPAQSEASLSATRWIWADIFREIAKMFLRELQGRIGLRCYVLIATGASGRLNN